MDIHNGLISQEERESLERGTLDAEQRISKTCEWWQYLLDRRKIPNRRVRESYLADWANTLGDSLCAKLIAAYEEIDRLKSEILDDQRPHSTERLTMETTTVLKGFAIAVLDRGFVYVGNVAIEKDWVRITNARNVRQWGTTKGLGELGLNGPTPNTKLDNCPDIHVPLHTLNHIMDTEEKKWKAS